MKCLAFLSFAIATLIAPIQIQAQQHPVQQDASSVGPGRDLSGFVKRWETFHPHPFQDVGGVNIGYGTRSHPGETSISEREAARRMDAELALDRAKIEQLNPQLPEGAKKALTSLLYNLGGDVNRLKEHGMAKAMADGNVEAMKKAHVEFSHIHGPQGTVLPGLLHRRLDELGFYNEGQEHADHQLGTNRSPPDVAVEGRQAPLAQRAQDPLGIEEFLERQKADEGISPRGTSPDLLPIDKP
jgi:GH24 family phage-related lysozyme (muramidase)